MVHSGTRPADESGIHDPAATNSGPIRGMTRRQARFDSGGRRVSRRRTVCPAARRLPVILTSSLRAVCFPCTLTRPHTPGRHGLLLARPTVDPSTLGRAAHLPRPSSRERQPPGHCLPNDPPRDVLVASGNRSAGRALSDGRGTPDRLRVDLPWSSPTPSVCVARLVARVHPYDASRSIHSEQDADCPES